MFSIDKIKVGSSTYNISPSKDGTLTGFTSNDFNTSSEWTDTDIVTVSDNNSSIFSINNCGVKPRSHYCISTTTC